MLYTATPKHGSQRYHKAEVQAYSNNNSHCVRASLPGRKHAVVLSVQLVSNDLIVRAHASLDRGSHDLLGDLPSEGLQVLLQDAEAGMSRPRGKTKKFT